MKAFISSTQVSGVTAADVSVGGVLTMSGQMHWQIMLGPVTLFVQDHSLDNIEQLGLLLSDLARKAKQQSDADPSKCVIVNQDTVVAVAGK